MTNTLITFEGLMIFHRDKSGFYELGILEVKNSPHYPDHELQICVTPEPNSHMGMWMLGAKDLDQYVSPKKNSWSLNVKDSSGGNETGITADTSVPNRHSPNAFDLRFGWILNIDQLHGAPQCRKSGKLKPIIHFSRGTLSTHCKTGGLTKWQHGNGDSFGFMAGVLALEIDTSAGQEVVLAVDGGPVIFRLPAGYSYQLSLTNMPSDMSNTNHFPAYYEYVFTHSQADSFDFEPDASAPKPPNSCDGMDMPSMRMAMRSARFPFGIPPYKCGGLLVDPVDPPLS
jgi:hypothetical protein